jgi:hypothetical protein
MLSKSRTTDILPFEKRSDKVNGLLNRNYPGIDGIFALKKI